MIIVSIRGGLGNQLFQYAFARAEAERLKASFVLDTSWYPKPGRAFQLDNFNTTYRMQLPNRLLAKFLKLFVSRSKIHEGFWEEYAPAASIRDILLKEFILKDPSPRFQELAAGLSANAISVHVRRGDFVGLPGKNVLGYAYYDFAVRRIIEAKKIAHPRVIVFSDDKDWCREHMQTLGGFATEVFEDPGVSDAEELVLMSRCAHNVIGNSTFSWWAAFLNQNPDKMVAVPQTWYTNPARNAETLKALIPPEWTVIQ